MSIFFPALNDAKIIPYLVNRAYKAAQEMAKKFEVIVVDDGSTDETAEVLDNLQNYYTDLKVISHKLNQGYGAALQDGIAAAKMKYVFYTDGDGQYDPYELRRLVARMENGIDVVNGKKKSRSDSWVRRVIGETYSLILHLLYPLPIEDVDCDFRLCKRSSLGKIKLTSSSGAICLEMVYKLALSGANFAEVEVNHYPRPYGLSEYFKLKNIYFTFLQQLQLYKELRTRTRFKT